jgi:hypothetical protein
MTVNVCDLGAIPDGDRTAATANDAAFQRAFDAFQTTGGTLEIPGGTYHLAQPLVLDRRRNVTLRGEGGNFIHPGTRLVFHGNHPAACLHLRTAIHCRFEGICFLAERDAPEAVVRIDAIEDGPRAVSSLNNVFHNCTFRAGASARPEIPGVSLRDAGHTEFRHCWFQTPQIAVAIGAAMRHPAPTISNGQCSNTAFDQCLFFADLVGERGTNVTLQNCEFATRTDGDGARIDFGFGAHPQICNVSIRDCFALNGTSHRGTFFTQGRGGAGLVMTNTRIRGYALAVALDGAGAAFLASNVFEQTGPGASDIRVQCPPDAVTLLANHHARTIQAGNSPVVYG